MEHRRRRHRRSDTPPLPENSNRGAVAVRFACAFVVSFLVTSALKAVRFAALAKAQIVGGVLAVVSGFTLLVAAVINMRTERMALERARLELERAKLDNETARLQARNKSHRDSGVSRHRPERSDRRKHS
jgi:hypothetical protein